MATTGIQSTSSLFYTPDPQASYAASASSTKESKLADLQSFLTMFTTQLKYQDPTNPLESYELSAQLAQFASVEKLTQIGTRLQEQNAYLASVNNAQMIGLIGKEISAASDSVRVTGGTVSKSSYQLDVPATVTVNIYDENRNLVNSIKVGQLEAGRHDIAWDGRNSSGQKVADGDYYCKVEALDAEGKTVDVMPTVNGVVHALLLDQGIAQLVLNGAQGIKVTAAQILQVVDSI